VPITSNIAASGKGSLRLGPLLQQGHAHVDALGANGSLRQNLPLLADYGGSRLVLLFHQWF